MQLFLIQFLQIVATAFTVLGLALASSSDTLYSNHSLVYGQNLTSAGSVFQFGFFNLVDDSVDVYVGIWYLNRRPSEGTVVWVANTKPLNGTTGSLNLNSSGNLTLSDEGTTIWSTNTSTELNSARLQLSNSGNLQLISGSSNRILWQSFEESSNCLLPGAKIGFNYLTNTTWKLVSWRSGTDPSPGDYEDRMESQGVPQIAIFNGSVKVYRFGPWNGHGFSGVPKMGASGVSFTYITDRTESYFMTNYEEGVSSAILSASLLAANGSYLRWHLQDEKWQPLWSIPEDDCDHYNLCGRNRLCTRGYYSHTCDCLQGFKVAGNGCEREKPLSCSSNYFSTVQKVKLPDTENAIAQSNLTPDACKSSCLGDCSCVAYAVVAEPNGCLTWRGDLLDLRTFTDGDDYLCVRLAEPLTSKRKQQLVWEITIPLLLGFILLCCLALLVIKRRNRKLRTAVESSAKSTSLQLQLEKGDLQELSEHSNSMDFDDASRLIVIGTGDYALYNNGVGPINALGPLPSYDLSTIRTATNNFSSENKLGEGGFGVVYKGQFQDGQKIAVKKLSRYSSQGPNEFQNELSLIAKLQHRNLVRLLGSCIEGDERLIVLEYMENKSLDAFIYDKTRSSLLNWQKRLEIINGIARGLLYLHQDSLLRVIHRDLKPSNILLDKDMIPKISDFGIARIFEGDGALENATTRPIGTIGYMAPEYLNDGVFSFKSDVFSFGVIVLEILSGKRNRMTSQTDDTSLNLLGHTYRLWKEGRSLEILDNALDCSYPITEILRSIRMSLLCVQDNIEDRPTMAEVVMMLASEDQLQTPFKQPTIISTITESQFTTKEMSLTITSR